MICPETAVDLAAPDTSPLNLACSIHSCNTLMHFTVDAGPFVVPGSRTIQPHRISRRDWIRATSAALGISVIAGCGTILHPERKGQPAGPIDWKVAALDGLGLLFFFIPGVIAFAVDFNNGTIYLPPEDCAERGRKADGRPLISRKIPKGKLSRPGVEAMVTEHVRRPVELEPGQYESRTLQRLDDFWTTHDELVTSSSGAQPDRLASGA